jgi:hypothetical protein
MITIYPERGRFLRLLALLLSAILTVPLLNSCGGGEKNQPVDQTGNAPTQPTVPSKKQGLTTGQKVGITLVGAAALYYLYKQHQKSQAKTGPQGQYYLSKNGQVYYRDAQGKPHFVTPPSGGIQVPASEAQQYSQFQGYDGRNTGRSLAGLGSQ